MIPFSSADFSLPPRDFEQDDAVSIGWQIRQAINNIKTRKNTTTTATYKKSNKNITFWSKGLSDLSDLSEELEAMIAPLCPCSSCK
jgi:hypothetical protein